MQNIDWDTFRYIVAIADSGSASAAAESLGVDASTVQRKITRFEKNHGLKLFERLRSGFTPSVECAAIIETARTMEESVNAIGRQVLGSDLRLEGRVTVTTTDTLAQNLLSTHLSAYQREHPQVVIDLSVTNSRLNLSRMDADIAIRPSLNPPPNLIAHRVAQLGMRLFSHPDLGSDMIDLKAIEDVSLPWIGLGEGLDGSPAYRWVRKNVPQSRVCITADTFPTIARLCEEKAGLAMIAASIGDKSSCLVRRSELIQECAAPLWVLTHPETRYSARIKSLSNWLVTSLKSDASIFEGQ